MPALGITLLLIKQFRIKYMTHHEMGAGKNYYYALSLVHVKIPPCFLRTKQAKLSEAIALTTARTYLKSADFQRQRPRYY